MIIAPSLLAADFGRFAQEAARADRTSAEYLHLDIMDGHFVPNISFGPAVVKAVRPAFTRYLDVHLMVSKPEILFDPFVQAGADGMTVHVELGNAVNALLWKIRSLGKRVGLAVNPPTNITAVKPYLSQIDLLLIMTVNPGFGGQPFIHECVPKIQQAAAWRKELQLNYRIEVDGGINDDTAEECAAAGADTFVAGTSLFQHRNLTAAVNRMRRRVDVASQSLFPT
ncbi:MAG: ribulose-phosphate 3-epimerase [Verrucomicrobia bacterium]|nr:ribulose-phosphate 3-epimerase [Verrucomicrobiota bacterium]